MIHPTAIVHPKAKVDPTTRVGPYAVIDEAVEVGPECIIGPHVYLTGITVIGPKNRFFAGAVIGEAPQDLKYTGEPSCLRIGERNTFRENVTVHRSNKTSTETVIGSNNLLMANCHVAHDCFLGNSIIVANGALLAGHVHVADRVLVSGNCLVHQFVSIGTLAMMQGGAGISKDLPPYTVARGNNGICGLNSVGLRRAGISSAARLELRQLYRALFREGLNIREAAKEAREKFSSPEALALLDFIASSKRGICADVGGTSASREDEGEEDDAP